MDLSKLNDIELYNLSLNGRREEVLSALYKKYSRNVYKYSLSLLKNPSLSEDLTHDAFLKAFSSFDSFKPIGDNGFKNYLFTIAHNTFINNRRKISKNLVNYMDEIYDSEKTPLAKSPEEEFIKSESHSCLNKHISGLSPAFQEIIKLRYFEELEYKEIEEKLEIPIGTVKGRLFNMHAKLKGIYGISNI